MSIKNSLKYIVLGTAFSKHLLPSVLALFPKEKIRGIEIELGFLKYRGLP